MLWNTIDLEWARPLQPMPKPSKGVIVHCSAGRQPKDRADAVAAIRAIHRYHRSKGWTGAGYHFALWDGGDVWGLRGWNTIGAHAKGYNARFHGVVYLGDGLNPTFEALSSLAEVIAAHDDANGEGLVLGHRDVSRKLCPGQGIYDWIKTHYELRGRP